MFATLELLPPQKRGFLSWNRGKAVVFAEKTALPGAFSFYRFFAEAVPNAVPWDAVFENANAKHVPLLLPAGLAAGTRIRLFEPRALPTRLLFHFAVKTLQTLRLDPAGRAVCLEDPMGLLKDEAAMLLPFGSTFYIAAPAGVYDETARRWLEESGVSVVLCRTLPRALDENAIVIADRAAAVPFSFCGLLFTNEESRFPFASVYTGAGLQLPAALEARRPPGIDPVLFASAASELCRYRLPDTLGYETAAAPVRLTEPEEKDII